MCLPGFDHGSKEQVSIGRHTVMPLAKRSSPIPKAIEQNKGEKWGELLVSNAAITRSVAAGGMRRSYPSAPTDRDLQRLLQHSNGI